MEYRNVVGAILLNERGEILLQQRDDKPDLRYAGYWTFFGGAVETGESPDEAIVRELIEELELSIPLQFWQSYVCPARTVAGEVQTTNHLYIGLVTQDLTTLTLHEGQTMRYFTPEEAQSLTLAFMQSPRLEAYFRQRPILACTWMPRGELNRLTRYLPSLKNIYRGIVVALKANEPGQKKIEQWFSDHGIQWVLYDEWSGRHAVIELALQTEGESIHYVDMDRLVRWVELYPAELWRVARTVTLYDSLIIGRSRAAYDTHSPTLTDTEALPNRFFSYFFSTDAMDFSAGSRGLSRRTAQFLLSVDQQVGIGQRNSLAMDVAWAILALRAGLSWGYLETDALDWETADRFRDQAAGRDEQRALAQQDAANVENWKRRVKVAQEITTLGLAALKQPIDQVNREKA
ncbi:MAG: NUDIX domain-containing protein [Anaerolineae bacterium]|jgi:8-oxo-dGTP pyrophosphatase MutT (NUDIX family)|nr:NUDIX domain-containing protein [Anaerolineae bacterium]